MISWMMMMMMMKMVMVENIMPCPNDHSTRFSHSPKDTQVIMLILMIMMLQMIMMVVIMMVTMVMEHALTVIATSREGAKVANYSG